MGRFHAALEACPLAARPSLDMSYSLNCFKHIGDYMGMCYGAIEGDTVSLDYDVHVTYVYTLPHPEP